MPVGPEKIAAFFAPVLVPVQELRNALLAEKQVTLLVRREDLLHPEISGNKWRNPKYNLLAAAENGFDTLMTFGGAYSNHVSYVAANGRQIGFKIIGLVRGEENLPLNPTLRKATENGMQLH